MKKRTRLIAGVMAMMLTLGGCGSAANTANKKEATQTTAEQTASSQEDTAEAAAKETELDVLKIGLAALPTQLDPDRSIGIAMRARKMAQAWKKIHLLCKKQFPYRKKPRRCLQLSCLQL